MKPLQVVSRFFSGTLVLISVVLWNGLSCNAYAQNAAQPQSKSPTGGPVTMTECEQGTDGCATWTFQGAQGIGQWPSGEIASLTYTMDGNTIVFHRAHSTGPSKGLEVNYTGTPDKDGISGKFEFSSNGQKKSGNWYAFATNAAPISPPSEMHLCLVVCQTWTLDKGAPFDKPHYGSEAGGMIAVVDSWTRESVVIHRTDFGRVPGTAVLTGKLSGDGNSIVDGNIAWTWHPCCGTTTKGRFVAAWGRAIETVRGFEGGSVQVQQSSPACGLDCAIKTGNTILSGLELLERLALLLN
jgi:hypothetical protein